MKNVLRTLMMATLLAGAFALPALADDTLVKFKGGIGVIPVSSGVVPAQTQPLTADAVNRNFVRGVNPPGQIWVISLGVTGYLAALLVDLVGGRALGRTGAMRLARAEQENRELRAEQARLLGAIRERDEKLAALPKHKAETPEG